ncbi:hypothetical protein L7F22_024520 [Adiantum nelumboides]|nr:hypothetical protein [Adiantum nelumboides]
MSVFNNPPHQRSLNNSAHYLAAAREAHDETGFDTLLGSTMIESQDDLVGPGLIQDVKRMEEMDQEGDNIHTNHCEGEEAAAGINDHCLESHAPEFGADMSKNASEKKHSNSVSSESDVGGNCSLKTGQTISSDPELNFDLRHLENSIKFFDLYHKSNPLTHPLRSMSSRSSTAELNAFEENDTAEIFCKQRHRQSFSNGIMKKDVTFENACQRKLESADLLPWLNYEGSKKKTLRNKVEKADFQITAHKNRILTMAADGFSETPGSSDSSPDWKGASSALVDKEKGGHSASYNELLGKAQVKQLWSNSQMEKSSGEMTKFDNNDLGPDEIGRYLESLDVHESYLDAMKNKMSSRDEANLHAGSDSYTDDCQTSSISGGPLLHTHCVLSANEVPFTVSSIQVVGARQQRGGSSMWQRMVGVKDHTVYCIKVVSGKHEWEVQRRYRDFMNFYHQLKRVFAGGGGTSLPSFSQEVENDSRKVLGNTSPTVVEARVACIEKFLQSLLLAGPPYSTATPLFWFLRPPQGTFEKTGFEEHLMAQGSTLHKSVDVQLGTLNVFPSPPSVLENNKKEQGQNGVPFTLGKTIKLVLTIHQNDSLRQVLHAQHHSCAGCYRHLDYGKGLIHGFVQAFGRGKPRFCEYTGQLFCSSCHLNELAVVPAYVLWHWDFTQKRVCQFAKAYMDSIYDQPLLCLTTANPYLYQRVPYLSNVQETRAKLSRVLSCMRCPFHSRILNVMGSRRYLLENNDFFALRDLEDLSKGAFAVLPGLLTSVLKTLLLHVTKQCSVCQDSGEWCGAGILCEDPFKPIFPFNEEVNVVKCKVCNAPFHQDCFTKCSSCPSCPKNWMGANPLTTSVKR